MGFSKKDTKRDKSKTSANSKNLAEKRKLIEKLILLSLDKKEVVEVAQNLQKKLEKEEQEFVPMEIFAGKLSPAEAVVKYLKENQQISFHEIALKINRDERGVWSSYARARKKQPSSFRIVKSVQTIPISILRNRKLAMLEAVVFYLKEKQDFSVEKIARLLNKSKSTIYTAYSRAKEKIRGTEKSKMLRDRVSGTANAVSGTSQKIRGEKK